MRLWATIKKDALLLWRDRVGLALMFGMPVVLVLLVTGIQNNAFPGARGAGVLTLVQNKDTGWASRELLFRMGAGGHFRIERMDTALDGAALRQAMDRRQAMMTISFPANFTFRVNALARQATNRSLRAFGLDEDTVPMGGVRAAGGNGPDLLFNASLEPGERLFTTQLFNSMLQGIQSSETLQLLYTAINGKQLPDSLAKSITGEQLVAREVPVDGGGGATPLNATQHNVPAWTIFAMFFVVMSLGGSVVKEKSGGSAIRLKTLPTNFLVALLSKELVYLGVTIVQALVIFGLGVWAFPLIGLPALRLPADGIALIVVTLLCGWCAVSYALLVGVFARTQEQSNGFGAISVVIMAMLGGLMVPAFIMPDGFRAVMRFSPLHWALQCYQGLFLRGGSLSHIGINIVPLAAIALLMQGTAILAIKRKRLI